jgi:hypothetical protein
MSTTDRPNKQPRSNTGAQRPAHFGVREDRPLRPEPQPLNRGRDPFEDVDVGPRAFSRSAVALKEREPARRPLITAKSVADDEPHAAPSVSRAAADLHRAQSFYEPAAPRRPSYYQPAAPRSSLFDLLPGGMGMAVIVSALCVAVIYLLWLQPAQTRFSSFPGGRSAPAAELPQVNPADYPQLPTPPGQTSLIGPPTVNAAAIDAILAQYGSPAAGTGQAWVELGIRYKIDPAYAVAFFIHESSAGTNPAWAGFKPDGSTTHNVGNIICAGYPTCFNRFRDYPNWETGIEDWYKLIAVEYISGRGTHTIEQIIPIYAPSFENDVPRYVAAVNDLVRSWRAEAARR